MTIQKWTEERTQALKNLVGSESPVTKETVESASTTLETTPRSVAAKLRKLGYEVESLAKEHASAFDATTTAALREFLENNSGSYTFSEIAALFADGQFSSKEIQGKVLSMELTGAVKPTPKKEVVKTYTEAEEARFVELAKSGAYIEDICAVLGKEEPSVRGKALSLLRNGTISSIPTKKSVKEAPVDPIDSLEDRIAGMTVEEIGAAINKTSRGVKTMLTRRGIKVADYDGAAKKAKNAEAA